MSLRLEIAHTPAQFAQMSLIHALGWRVTYADAVPADFMAREITDDHWVPYFSADYEKGENWGLILYDNDVAVCCGSFGPARTGASPQQSPDLVFDNGAYQGWGEVISFYTHPDHTGKGYGAVVMEEGLRLLAQRGFQNCYVLVLQENDGARRFYARHGFAWDGTHQDIPFPPDTICRDLRYVRALV